MDLLNTTHGSQINNFCLKTVILQSIPRVLSKINLLVKHLTLNLTSGHDLIGPEIKPHDPLHIQ